MALTNVQLRDASLVVDGNPADTPPMGLDFLCSRLLRTVSAIRSIIGMIQVVSHDTDPPTFEIVEHEPGMHYEIPEATGVAMLQQRKQRARELIAQMDALLQ